MKLTIDEIVDCRTDLLSFTKTMFKARKGTDFIENWHHKVICNALERVVIGECKRLIINIPPRYSKTELAVVNFIAWCIGNFPDAEFIHASYSKRLAASNSWSARTLVQDELFTEIFGKPAIRDDSNAKDEWRTEQGGCVYATGTAGTITGYGAGKLRDTFGGCIIIDDPIKAGEANSDIVRESVNEWFTTTLESRKNSTDTPIIVIMQRLHEEDLAGWLLKGNNGEEWEHLCLPALDEDGVPLWEFKQTAAELRRLELSNPYVFAGQYMQRPSPIGGGLIRGEWFGRYTQLPKITYRAMFIDTAQKAGQHNDYQVAEVWGYGSDGRIYLLDMLRAKFQAYELEERIPAFWAKHMAITGMGTLRAAYIEDKSSGTELIQKMRNKIRPSIPVIPVKRTVGKVERVMDVQGYIASGNVCIPHASLGLPWVSDFVAECEAFTATNSHSHDDQIDPMCDAISTMLHNKVVSFADIL